jgi:phosphoribosyl-ATP pyrophosphohydrolase
MKNFEIEKHPQEIADKLYEMQKDMNFADYEEEKEKIVKELTDCLYVLMANAQNEYNMDYWRTLYRVLENI